MCAGERCEYYKKYGECSSEYGNGERQVVGDGMVKVVWGNVFERDF